MEEVTPTKDSISVPNTGFTGSVIEKIDNAFLLAARILLCIAGVGLVTMLLLMVSDVIGIKVFRSPVPGTIEYVSFISSIMLAFAFCYTYVKGAHIAVEFVLNSLPRRLALIVNILTFLMSVCIMSMLMYYTFRYAGRIHSSGELSMTQRIPYYPFIYSLAFCFAITLLCIVKDFIKFILGVGKKWNR